MKNKFYNSFDFETYGAARKTDYRSPFQIDRDRIIHAHAFRKLQSKTQVFLSGEYDFYRTRLTHSIEAAQIGRSICNFLQSCSKSLSESFYIDSDLVEAVCLAHDLGHPPFGHSGERTLQELMKAYGGFEGNAQTLHLLTDTMYQTSDGVRGMQPTRALLDGVLKYKKLFSEFSLTPENHFLYDSQKSIRLFVTGGEKIPAVLNKGDKLNFFKSVECQIMDWADDSAYSLNDIVDGVRAGFLTPDKIENWADLNGFNSTKNPIIKELLWAIKNDLTETVFSQKIGSFIKACSLAPRECFLSDKTNRFSYQLIVDNEVQVEALIYKKIANDIIFESPQLQQMEHKARVILFQLWESAWKNYIIKKGRIIHVLPPHIGRLIDSEKLESMKARRVCDWLAGLTDVMIVQTHRRLFDPQFGSFRDLS